MAEPEKKIIDRVELLLNGSILKTPIEISGALAKEGSTNEIEFSGKAKYGKPLSLFLADLADCFDKSAGAKLTELLGKQAQSLLLDSLTFSYQQADPKLAQIIVAMSVGDNRYEFTAIKMFATNKNPESGGFAIGLNLKSTGAPIMGNTLEGLIGKIAFKDLGIHYASEELKNVSYYPMEGTGADEISAAALLGPTKRDFSKGFNVKADILIGGVNPFEAPAGNKTPVLASLRDTTSQPENRQPAASSGTSAPSTNDPIKWFEASKTIGPLSLRRVGFGYQAPRIAIKLDAGLQLSCLTFTLEGLGLSYPIDQFSTDPKKIWEHLRFNLDGASLCFTQGPLTISGGLLKVSDDPLQLDGTLLIRTPLFALSAIGSYANLNGTPSFFMFAALIKELGGPSFFFVTGLAFGFGVNRTLTLPHLNDVENFPLIRAATDENYLGTKLDLRAISQKLGQYISPSVGNYWIAAGIKFSSFGQIDSFVLLSVSFGTRLEFGLLGLSKLQVPKLLPGSSTNVLPVIVYAEMAIRAVVAPDTGLLCFEARLTENSYLLRKDFKLRGGFAFYTWFAGEHEGDFAISIGGYHNKFKAPAHYPRPDLVEFCCKIGDTVTIQGECYFALCPSAIMAGGRLSFVFQTEHIRAWFIAYAHFLIQWKPVYYDVSIGVSVGVALHLEIGLIRINLAIELSASLDLYGPPLGGKATLSLYVITVTVTFGEAKSLPPPLVWESSDIEKSFAKAFLPNPEVNRITISEGLLKSFEDQPLKLPSLVNPHQLVLNCRTLVPATEIHYNGRIFSRDAAESADRVIQPKVNGKPTELGIRPMNKSSLYSLLEITLAPVSDTSKAAQDFLKQYIKVTLTTKSVPVALWSNTSLDLKTPPEGQMIDEVLVGLVITTLPGPRPWETEALSLEVLAFDPKDKHFDWVKTQQTEAFPANGLTDLANLANIGQPGIVERRKKIVNLLKATHSELMNSDDIKLTQLSANAQYIFQAPPLMARAGQEPPGTHS